MIERAPIILGIQQKNGHHLSSGVRDHVCNLVEQYDNYIGNLCRLEMVHDYYFRELDYWSSQVDEFGEIRDHAKRVLFILRETFLRCEKYIKDLNA